jgi:hypothetical protein
MPLIVPCRELLAPHHPPPQQPSVRAPKLGLDPRCRDLRPTTAYTNLELIRHHLEWRLVAGMEIRWSDSALPLELKMLAYHDTLVPKRTRPPFASVIYMELEAKEVVNHLGLTRGEPWQGS